MRNYRDELKDKLSQDSLAYVLAFVGDVDSLVRLAKNAGHVQGLKAAADLYDEIRKDNNAPQRKENG